ncbi:hypothetical protein [Clostridium tyrobutyricum]|uniref:hypothetical protein n=1 Tax=Clostridium tyrobutyricum TaxID=1519 RepID=UPI00073D4F9F|nr:hypothetical protein [Clostridium tyrobutyricum]
MSKNLIELDKQLIELNKKYYEYENFFERVECEIEDLKEERGALQRLISETNQKIKRNKRLIYGLEGFKIDKKDDFLIKFIKASYFCNHDDVCKSIDCVQIHDNYLLALDGYKAIIIRSNLIPDELKNKKIKWNVRENFKENIIEDKREIIDPTELFDNSKTHKKYIFKDITKNDFLKRFTVGDIDEKYNNITIFKFNDMYIGINMEFIKKAFICIENKFDVYVSSPVKPIVFQNNDVSILILPIRLTNYQDTIRLLETNKKASEGHEM